MNYEELDFGPLEERIGYHFKDPTLLRTALTHKSFASEYHVREVPQYERLEFLGDSILEYISSEALFERYPKLPEGELTKKRASLVCEYTLSQITKELGYGDYVILGKGEDLTGGRERPSILCDLFESVLGAIYLDGGMEPAKTYVERHLLTDLERVSDHCSNIAVALIELRVGSFDTHEYLDVELQKRNKNFEQYYQAYKTRFALH